MGRIAEYDRRRARLLAVLFPLSIALHLALLLDIERANRRAEVPIRVGYEGPAMFLPHISVLDEQTIEYAMATHRRKAMFVQDVVIEGERLEKREKRTAGREPSPRVARKVNPVNRVPTIPAEDKTRVYPSLAWSPYREDYVILRFVQPEYPPDALAQMAEGYALVEAYVNEYGQVSAVSVRAAYGPHSFETSALDAVRQFLFRPVRSNGRPASFWVSFYVRFQLRH